MIFKELDGGLSVIDNLKVAGAKEGNCAGKPCPGCQCHRGRT